MTQKTKRIVIVGIAICALSAVALLFSAGVIGVSADNIERDARKSQKVDTWEVSKSVNDKLGAMIFYSDTLDAHIFSIYLNRDGFSFGYFFRTGGSDSIIMDGVHEFAYDTYGSAIISMNKVGVARIVLDNGADATRIDIDPSKPFAVVIPENCGLVTLFDINENTVPITATRND